MQTKRKRRRYAAPVGGIFVVLALIGAITVVVASIQLTLRVLDNSSEKEEIQNIIRPVVMFNPAPFERVTDIEAIPMLQYCMWATLIEKYETYTYGENAELLVPASDLDVAGARLFGDEVKLQHQAFGDYENRYYYDAKDSVYNVPNLTTQMTVYRPQVEEIVKEDELYRVLVGYMAPNSAWNAGDQAPEKYMYYIMNKVGNTYQIVAVRDVVSGSTHYLPETE